MKRLIPAFLMLLAGCTSTGLLTGPSVDIEYDRFNNNTTYTSSDFKMKGLALVGNDAMFHHSIDASVYAVCEGQGVCPLDEVTLHIKSSSDKWEYLSYRPLIFLVDGERMDLGEVEHHGDVFSGSVLEQLFYTLSIEQFMELAHARLVEGKLGITEFTLDYNRREVLRLFASRLALNQANTE